LEEAKKKYEDQICLMGGYDPHFYTLGTKEDISAETIRCIREAAEGGGYILAHSDAVPEEARMEDVRFSADLATEFGSYMGEN
jgi:uroporphyrinogen-III decarboxylase